MIRFGTVTIDRRRKVISNGERSRHFPPASDPKDRNYATFDMLQHLLLSGGISRRRLVDYLYGDREDGGPQNQWDHISVMLCHCKPILTELGMMLRSEAVAGYKHYWVVTQ